MYQAIITALRNVREHPNADRLRLATCCGDQVVVGLDNYEGQLGAYFPADGCISERMAFENNLNSNPKENKDQERKGFFGKNRRVRAQNLRQEKSYGFWAELDSLAWTEVATEELEEGLQFTALNGQEVCKKYINPATLRRAGSNKQNGEKLSTKLKKRFSNLKEHSDTKQLRYEINRIPDGSIIYLTEKAHGISGRSGHVKGLIPLTRKQLWWNKWMGWTGKVYTSESEYRVVSGSRRVVLDPDQKTDEGFYSGKIFRIDIHRSLEEAGILKGLTLYYEIVGFDETGAAIMSGQSIEKIGDKKLRKLMKQKYGDEMTYSYGCEYDDPEPSRRYDIFVYDITFTNEDGDSWRLSWPLIKSICRNLGVFHVPEIGCGRWDYKAPEDSRDENPFFEYVQSFLDEDSTIDSRHIIEGLCARIQAPNGEIYILKDKGFAFKVLEGIVKSDDSIIDTEEAEDLAAEEIE